VTVSINLFAQCGRIGRENGAVLRGQMADIFQFEWPVDQAGYELQQAVSFKTSLTGPEIRARGGPPRYYRPLEEHPGLWRRFAATCNSAVGVLDFVSHFGLLGEGPSFGVLGDDHVTRFPRPDESLAYIVSAAGFIRRIVDMLDVEDRKAAAELFTEEAKPRLTAGLIWPERKPLPVFHLIPRTLHSALLLQAAEAITGDQKFRQCRNDDCPEWFRLGSGAFTSRREFCSDRCRVAWARRHKSKREA
jgi:hypothetical protein